MRWWPFGQKDETRSAGTGFTADVLAARESYISGSRGAGELTAVVQGCVSLWEGALAAADVEGTRLLDRRSLAMAARSLGFRGEAVFLIRDRLIPVADWDVSTRNGQPRAYRCSVSEAGGGRTETALAPEVIHLRIGSDAVSPWAGQAPLRRAPVTSAMLAAIESSLREVYENAPIGSQIVPYPEGPDTDLEKMGRGFRGRRGRVLLRESVNVAAAGGPAPAQDWRPQDVTPDLSKAMTQESLRSARGAMAMAYGVLPALLDDKAQGPLVREAQRHLAMWTLQPICDLLGEEASDKLGADVTIDVTRPLQAFDAGGRARAVTAVVEALARAKEAGIPASDVDGIMKMVDW